MSDAPSDAPGLAIVILDDNRVFADVLALRLREEPGVERVAVAATVAEAVVELVLRPGDLVLVDHHASADAIAQELMSELSGLVDRPAVLVLAGETDHRTVVAALESGVRGWASTDYSFATLWTAVREVTHGHMVLSPATVEPIVDRLLASIRDERRADRVDFVTALSPREYEVLRCLVAGMVKKEIAQRLYLSVNTVRTHVQHLLRAADVHSTGALVAAARDLDVTGIDAGR